MFYVYDRENARLALNGEHISPVPQQGSIVSVYESWVSSLLCFAVQLGHPTAGTAYGSKRPKWWWMAAFPCNVSYFNSNLPSIGPLFSQSFITIAPLPLPAPREKRWHYSFCVLAKPRGPLAYGCIVQSGRCSPSFSMDNFPLQNRSIVCFQ